MLNNLSLIQHLLRSEKKSVLPASALALSTALLMAKRTDELRHSGGSPTAKVDSHLNELDCLIDTRKETI